MKRGTRTRAFALVCAMLVAAPALAQPSGDAAMLEARARYKRGVELYEEGRYPAALVELERANQLAPSYKILESIGLVEIELGDSAGALAALEGYLTAGADAIDPARRKATEERIARLKTRVASIAVRTNVDGAQIAIDDVVVGVTPLATPVIVNSGRRKVTASLRGHDPDTKWVSAAGTDRVDVTFELVPRPVDAPPPPPPREPPAPIVVPLVVAVAPPPRAPALPPPNQVPWLGWTVTGALAAGAVATGIYALSTASDLRQRKNDAPAAGADLTALSSRAKAWALASDLCTGAAIVAGGVSLYLTVRGRSAEPALRVGLGHVALDGRF